MLMCMTLFARPVHSQVTAAKLQASGLTCALCAKSIFTNLSALPFVDSVDTDLNASAFLIKFKSNKDVDPQMLRKKVEDAGFFVSDLELQIQLNNQPVANDAVVKSSGSAYQFKGVKSATLDGSIKVQLIDKAFLSAKEYKKLSAGQKSLIDEVANPNVFSVRVIK